MEFKRFFMKLKEKRDNKLEKYDKLTNLRSFLQFHEKPGEVHLYFRSPAMSTDFHGQRGGYIHTQNSLVTTQTDLTTLRPVWTNFWPFYRFLDPLIIKNQLKWPKSPSGGKICKKPIERAKNKTEPIA
jgi:hypothetical protein